MSQSICELFDQSFQRFKNNTALTYHHPNGESTAISFSQLKDMAGQVYSLLDELKKEECIGLYMQRSVEHVASIVASLYSTSPYTTINHLVSARQVSYIAKDSNLKVLLCDNAAILKLRTLTQNETDQETLSNIRIVHLYSSTTLPPVYQKTVELLSKFTTVKSVKLADSKPHDLLAPDTKPENDAKLVLFTSGSTGNPKGVMIKGEDLVNRITSESVAYELQEGDVLLNILPFSFDVGCNQLFTSLATGCNLVLLNSWMPKDIVSVILQYKVNGVSGVPSIWLSIINSSLDTLSQMNSVLRYITISGGDMAEKDRLALRDLLPGVKIFKTYGQTETFRSAMLLAEDFDVKHQSVGKPVEGVSLSILDENGKKLGSGEIGQIIHQGTGTMLGYIGDIDATTRKLKQLSKDKKDQIIFTGDLGSIDEDGFLYLHGRQDRMFKVRGNRVYPEEIEKELCTHEGVLEAVSSYNASDEAITVYVRGRQDAALTEKSILKYLSARLPSYMVPSNCLLYKNFPRTASGKVDMPALIKQRK